MAKALLLIFLTIQVTLSLAQLPTYDASLCQCCGPHEKKPSFCRYARVDCRNCPVRDLPRECQCCEVSTALAPAPEFCQQVRVDCVGTCGKGPKEPEPDRFCSECCPKTLIETSFCRMNSGRECKSCLALPILDEPDTCQCCKKGVLLPPFCASTLVNCNECLRSKPDPIHDIFCHKCCTSGIKNYKSRFCNKVKRSCRSCLLHNPIPILDTCDCCKKGHLPSFCASALVDCEACPDTKPDPIDKPDRFCTDCCIESLAIRKPRYCNRVRRDCRGCFARPPTPLDTCECCKKGPVPSFCIAALVNCDKCPREEEPRDLCECCSGIEPAFCAGANVDCLNDCHPPPLPDICDCCTGALKLPSFCEGTNVDCRAICPAPPKEDPCECCSNSGRLPEFCHLIDIDCNGSCKPPGFPEPVRVCDCCLGKNPPPDFCAFTTVNCATCPIVEPIPEDLCECCDNNRHRPLPEFCTRAFVDCRKSCSGLPTYEEDLSRITFS